MNYNEQEPIEATVAELRPQMKNVTTHFKVISMGEEREIESRNDGSTHRVCDITVGDASGTVQVPLWDDAIDDIEEGATYNLTNGYTGLFRGNLRLNVGRYGKLEKAEEEIEEVNTQVDMSAEEHEDNRPRRNYGGGGGRSGNRRGSGQHNSSYGGRSSGSYGGRDRRSSGGYGGDRRSRY